MIEDLSRVLILTQDMLWSGIIVFIRVGAMMSVIPAFGEQNVPMRLRLAAALAFTALVAPIISDETMSAPAGSTNYLLLLAPEVLAGLFFGLGLRFFVFVLQIAGSIVAQSTSLSQIFGGSAGVDPQPAMGRILVVAGLALAASMGLHVHIFAYMIQSYEMVPVGVLIGPNVIMNLGIAAVARTFSLGFTLAAPFVIASLIYNVTLGVINRAMPQLMVSFVGAPAITAGGLILMAIAAPVLLSVWIEAFGSFLTDPFGERP